jgi:hypothetical protein
MGFVASNVSWYRRAEGFPTKGVSADLPISFFAGILTIDEKSRVQFLFFVLSATTQTVAHMI